MTKPPEPPKGYVLWKHKSTDFVPEGALSKSHDCDWSPSNLCGSNPDPDFVYAVPIKQPNDDWTPMPGYGEGGRLPTEEDGEMFGLTLRDKDGTYFVSEKWKRSNFPPNTAAWRKQEKLKPWNPPEPEKTQKPQAKPREWWISDDFIPGADTRVAQSMPSKKYSTHVRQVLPGDPTPEDVREKGAEIERLHEVYSKATNELIGIMKPLAEACGKPVTKHNYPVLTGACAVEDLPREVVAVALKEIERLKELLMETGRTDYRSILRAHCD